MYSQGLISEKLDHRNEIRRARRTLRIGKVPFLDLLLNWLLPSEGQRGKTCGDFKTIKRGCLNLSAHPEGKVYVVHDSIHCKNPRCPECAKHWIAREAMRATKRLIALSRKYDSPIKHVVISPPRWKWRDFEYLDTYIKARTEAYKVAKTAGLRGIMLVFHPKRGQNWSPHFHALGIGWVEDLRKTQSLTKGWVVKNLGKRTTQKSIYATLRYELDHCGIPQAHKGRSIVSPITWAGKAAYNQKLEVPDDPLKDHCPYCGEKLVPVKWYGVGDHPLKDVSEGDLLVDPGGWDYAFSEIDGGYYR